MGDEVRGERFEVNLAMGRVGFVYACMKFVYSMGINNSSPCNSVHERDHGENPSSIAESLTRRP